LKAITLPFPQRAFTALRHPERYLSKVMQTFLATVKDKNP